MRIPFPMLHRRLRPIALTAALCAFCLCLAPIRLTAAQPLRVCLLLESDVPDKGWHDLLREGLARAAREHHVAARVAVAPAGPEQQDIFRQEAANADLLIVADDSLHEILRNNAAAFPRVRFGCIDIGVRAANIMSVSFADEQAAFLAGVAAAMLTTSDSRGMNPQKTLGWLSGQETGPIVTMLNGFLEGARLVDPQMRIVHRTVGSFEDAEGARARCREILDEGADIVVLAAGSAGLAALDMLAEREALAIVMAADQDNLRPGVVLTSILKQGDRAVAEIVGSLAQGRFQGAEILTYDLSGKGVGITDFGPFAHSAGNRLPPRLTSRIAELKGELERGNIRLPSLRQRTLCNCR